jgi:biotin carboxylase
MAHALVLELAGGNDIDILDAIISAGHSFTFLTSDLALYQQQPAVAAVLAHAVECLEFPGFTYAHLEATLVERHVTRPFDALICMVDIRIVDAARLARSLGLRFLNPQTASLLRDKFSVRQKLEASGIAQAGHMLATDEQEMMAAIEKLGFPVLIKPCDGYASQNVVVIGGPEDLEPWISPMPSLAAQSTDYGLGVHSNRRFMVERYLTGTFIGCDTMSVGGRHHFLGVNEKVMCPPPSFTIRGGCFMPAAPEMEKLSAYAFSLLDAVGFDFGAAHIEMMITAEGPQLIEINPRLVSAKIPRLMGYGLGRSVYADLVSLHLGDASFLTQAHESLFAVTRWILADRVGRLTSVILPEWTDAGIRSFEILKPMGAPVGPPFENVDRIGYVMTSAATRKEAETLAERWVADLRLVIAQD